MHRLKHIIHVYIVLLTVGLLFYGAYWLLQHENNYALSKYLGWPETYQIHVGASFLRWGKHDLVIYFSEKNHKGSAHKIELSTFHAKLIVEDEYTSIEAKSFHGQSPDWRAVEDKVMESRVTEETLIQFIASPNYENQILQEHKTLKTLIDGLLDKEMTVDQVQPFMESFSPQYHIVFFQVVNLWERRQRQIKFYSVVINGIAVAILVIYLITLLMMRRRYQRALQAMDLKDVHNRESQ